MSLLSCPVSTYVVYVWSEGVGALVKLGFADWLVC